MGIWGVYNILIDNALPLGVFLPDALGPKYEDQPTKKENADEVARHTDT